MISRRDFLKFLGLTALVPETSIEMLEAASRDMDAVADHAVSYFDSMYVALDGLDISDEAQSFVASYLVGHIPSYDDGHPHLLRGLQDCRFDIKSIYTEKIHRILQRKCDEARPMELKWRMSRAAVGPTNPAFSIPVSCTGYSVQSEVGMLQTIEAEFTAKV